MLDIDSFIYFDIINVIVYIANFLIEVNSEIKMFFLYVLFFCGAREPSKSFPLAMIVQTK